MIFKIFSSYLSPLSHYSKRIMSNIIPLILSSIGLYFYFNLTGLTGLMIIVLIILAILVFVYFKQNMLLYLPIVQGMRRSPSANPFGLRHPSQHDLQSFNLELFSPDGVIIRGWHIKSPTTKRIVIYFHENAGNIGTRLYYAKNFVSINCDVVLVAYRGYSDSQSSPSEQGIMKDSLAIMEYAMNYSKNNGSIPIYILGRSLGGAVAINLASQDFYKDKIAGLILQNTFTSISDMIDYLLPVFKFLKFLQKNYWPSIDRISSIICPILFIKSLKDEIVPTEQMNELMKAAKAPKMEYIIEQGKHNAPWIIEPVKYFTNIEQFFQQTQK